MPEFYQTRHGFVLHSFFNNAVSYCGYVMLLSAPFSLGGWVKKFQLRAIATHAVIGAVLFVIGYRFLSNTGEMNFGPLDALINERVFSGILAVLFVCFIDRICECLKEAKRCIVRHSRRILAGLPAVVVAVLIALSLTRPAQRYLLFLLPFFIFLIPAANFKNVPLKVLWFSAVIFLNSYLALSQYLTGMAAKLMITYIREHSLEKVSDLGAIEGHVGSITLFEYRENSKSYVVVNGSTKTLGSPIYRVTSGYPPYLGKTYSLIRLSNAGSTSGRLLVNQ